MLYELLYGPPSHSNPAEPRSQQYFRPSEIVTPEALVEVARTKMSLRRQLTHEEAQMAILMVLHKSTVIEADVAVILKNLRAD